MIAPGAWLPGACFRFGPGWAGVAQAKLPVERSMTRKVSQIGIDVSHRLCRLSLGWCMIGWMKTWMIVGERTERMELSEKIQKLRKERGLTQEGFAELLFVSRTAVSKWETGRGTPSIESLQMIAKLCGITLDELLRAEEVIAVAENENKEIMDRFASRIDGIFDMAAILGLLLPLYKVEMDGAFYSVPLYRFEGWLAALYWAFPVVMAVCGMVQIVMSRSGQDGHKGMVEALGTIVDAVAVVVLILSGQPYPAVLFFALLLIKGTVMAMKRK